MTNSKKNLSIFQRDLSFFYQVEKEDVNNSNIGWVKKHETQQGSKYHAIIYTRPLENTEYQVIRTEGVYYNLSKDKFVQHFKKYGGGNQNKELHEEDRIFARDKDGYPTEIYSKSKASMFFGSRDCIIKIKIQEEANGDIVSLIHSVERSDIPIPENTVRLDVWKGQRVW